MPSRPHSRIRPGLIAVIGAAFVSILFVVGTRSGDSSSSSLLGFAFLAILTGLVLYSLALLLVLHDHEADELSVRLIRDPEGAELVARWLHRTRFYRNLGGLVGLILWVSSWNNGMNGSTVVAFGMGGILVGAIASELHRTRVASDPQTASLTPRRITNYLVTRDKRRTAVLVAIWLATAVASVFAEAGITPIVLAVLAVFVTGGVVALQHRVATRPRPLLPPALERADDLCRELAITRSLAQPLNALSVALLVPAFQSFAGSQLEGFTAALVVAAWLTSVWWWAKNKRLGLDWLLDEPVASDPTSPMYEGAAR